LRRWNCIYPKYKITPFKIFNFQKITYAESILLCVQVEDDPKFYWWWIWERLLLHVWVNEVIIQLVKISSTFHGTQKFFFYHPEPNNPVCTILSSFFSPLNTELNPICHLLKLLGAHHILHVSRIRVKICFNIILLTSGFPSETLCAFLFSPMHAHTPRISSLLLTVIYNGQHIKWGLIACASVFFISEHSWEILTKFGT